MLTPAVQAPLADSPPLIVHVGDPGPERAGAGAAASDPFNAAVALRTTPQVMDEGFALSNRQWIQLVGMLALGTVLVAAGPLLAPMVTGALLALMLWPLVSHLRRWGVPQPLGAALVVAVFIAAMAGALWLISSPVDDFATRWPAMRNALEAKALAWRNVVSPNKSFVTRAAAGPVVDWWSTAQHIGSFTAGTAKAVAARLATLFAVMYALLAFGDRLLVRALGSLLTRQRGQRLARALVATQAALQAYWGVVAVMNGCTAMILAAVLGLAGMPHPLAWGLLAGLLNFIPFVGPILYVLLLWFGVLASMSGPAVVLLPLFYLGLHIAESQLITPAVLGSRLSVNPALLIISVLVGGWAWGAMGALVAVPMLLCGKVLVDHLSMPLIRGEVFDRTP